MAAPDWQIDFLVTPTNLRSLSLVPSASSKGASTPSLPSSWPNPDLLNPLPEALQIPGKLPLPAVQIRWTMLEGVFASKWVPAASVVNSMPLHPFPLLNKVKNNNNNNNNNNTATTITIPSSHSQSTRAWKASAAFQLTSNEKSNNLESVQRWWSFLNESNVKVEAVQLFQPGCALTDATTGAPCDPPPLVEVSLGSWSGSLWNLFFEPCSSFHEGSNALRDSKGAMKRSTSIALTPPPHAFLAAPPALSITTKALWWATPEFHNTIAQPIALSSTTSTPSTGPMNKGIVDDSDSDGSDHSPIVAHRCSASTSHLARASSAPSRSFKARPMPASFRTRSSTSVSSKKSTSSSKSAAPSPPPPPPQSRVESLEKMLQDLGSFARTSSTHSDLPTESHMFKASKVPMTSRSKTRLNASSISTKSSTSSSKHLTHSASRSRTKTAAKPATGSTNVSVLARRRRRASKADDPADHASVLSDRIDTVLARYERLAAPPPSLAYLDDPTIDLSSNNPPPSRSRSMSTAKGSGSSHTHTTTTASTTLSTNRTLGDIYPTVDELRASLDADGNDHFSDDDDGDGDANTTNADHRALLHRNTPLDHDDTGYNAFAHNLQDQTGPLDPVSGLENPLQSLTLDNVRESSPPLPSSPSSQTAPNQLEQPRRPSRPAILNRTPNDPFVRPGRHLMLFDPSEPSHGWVDALRANPDLAWKASGVPHPLSADSGPPRRLNPYQTAMTQEQATKEWVKERTMDAIAKDIQQAELRGPPTVTKDASARERYEALFSHVQRRHWAASRGVLLQVHNRF